MIFDCDLVTDLVIEWQDTQDNVVLSDIVEHSRPLVEAIVSTFDYEYRDDLIQESLIRIQRAIVSFNPDISNLYNYFVTVIRNICITYLKKQGKEPFTSIEEYDIFYEYIDDEEYILADLIARNRHRFPSIPVDDVDDVTEFIYHVLAGEGKRPTGVISELMENFDLEHPIATVIYHSTIVYLRGKYRTNANGNISTTEFSLTRDLEELLGEDMFSKIALMFHGMYIRIS